MNRHSPQAPFQLRFAAEHGGMGTPHQLVTLEELARRLPVSKRWLQREALAGRIPSLVAGKRRLFNTEAVRAAIAERAAKAEGGAA